MKKTIGGGSDDDDSDEDSDFDDDSEEEEKKSKPKSKPVAAKIGGKYTGGSDAKKSGAMDYFMKKAGKDVEESSDISMSEEEEDPPIPVIETSMTSIPVVETS